MSNRIEKVNSLLEHEISKILQKEVIFPDSVMVTLTHVEASANLIEAKICISVFPDERTENILAILARETYGIQKQINRKLKMRPVPKIIFVSDKDTVKAGKIEEILARLKKEGK